MKEYENPDRHFNRRMKAEADKYVDGLDRAGLSSNPTLERAMAARALDEAREDYERVAKQTREHNIGEVIYRHTQDMNRIKRDGARLRLWTCPPIALLFGVMAWYSFSQSTSVGFPGFIMGGIYTFGALAFLGMLVFGAIFDRPKKIR